jgi:Family of unknown function (DUF6962)
MTTMTTDRDASLPRWGGMTEPTTVLTNLALSGVAFVLGVRLAYAAMGAGVASSGAMAAGLLSAAVAAVLGAAAHGIDPRVDRAQRERAWRAALYATGLTGAASVASVAFFTARGAVRATILAFAAVKFLGYLVRVARRPDFRVAAMDYGGALAVLLVGAAYALVRWRAPGTTWLIGGVLVSLVAGLVQVRRVALHRHFNHNDLYHLIQIVALYMFYRGGALLVDR